MAGRFSRALKIQPGEGRIASLVLLLMFVLLFGSALGANAVESLFFVRFGPDFLPVLYVILGVVTFLVMTMLSPLIARSARGRFATLAPLVLSVVVLGMRALALTEQRWGYPVLWLVMMVVWSVSVLSAWAVAGAVHDTRQAKRLFPLYGSGLVVGIVVGGLATGPVAAWLGTENLLLVWAAALATVFVLARSATAGAVQPRRRRGDRRGLVAELGEGVRVVRFSPLLRWMAVSLALFALLYFSLAFLFAESATTRFPDTDRLAGFLGLFMGAANGAALLVSLFVANRLFAAFGVMTMVLLLPVIYVVGFGALALSPTFTIVVAARFIQMIWVNGVWGPGWQAVFNVVPPERRDRVRAFMDGIPLQAGVVASGLMLILAQRVLEPAQVALVGAGAAVLATAACLRARRAYAGAVLEALRAGNPEVFVPQEEPFGGFRRDAAALAELERRASDPDPAVRRISMEVLAEAGASETLGALRRGLSDEDAVVRAAALRGVARAGDAESLPELRDALGHPNPDVRVEAVEGLAAIEDRSALGRSLQPMLSDPDPRVRATAAAVFPDSPDGKGGEVLRSLASSPRPEDRAAAVIALARAGGEPDELLTALGDPDLTVREQAVDAVVARGDPMVPWLLEALAAPRLENGAVLALSRMGGVERSALQRYGRGQVDRATRYAGVLRALSVDGDERMGLASHAVRDRCLHHATSALRAVGGFTDPTAVRLAIEDLASPDPEQRANALEALEAVGDRTIVRPLLQIWESTWASGDPEEALLQLMRDEDPWLRACAAFAARARGPTVRTELRRLAGSDADTLVREVAVSALEGDLGVEAVSSLSLMERVLFLRKVPLFAELSPADLKQIGEVATESVFPDGETIAEQGESGEEMYIVLSGEIRIVVRRDGSEPVEVARRGAGEYVGEMAPISREPRMGSLVCSGEVRALTLARSRLERILRERPEASLAMMRVLCSRLREPYVQAGGG
ncbi:MAG: HEAT repeat domain-containing protein [Actinomycetota bacterium]